MLLFYKSVDQSVFRDGFAIPVNYKGRLFEALGGTIARGEQRPVTLLINGVAQQAGIRNVMIDSRRVNDELRLVYGEDGSLARALMSVFAYSHRQGSTRIDTLPESQKEYIAIYSTGKPGILQLDCIRNAELVEESTEIAAFGEAASELILDGSVPITLRTKHNKLRKLSRSISTDLKEAYGYRCQICGMPTGEKYGTKLAHAHHIDYFTKSTNINADNIMILCPGHHAIVHDRNPIFDRQRKKFYYPNGYVEGLVVNRHL